MEFNTDLFGKLSFKYQNDVPEGYDISQIRFTYDFINLVFKRDAGIDDAIRAVANEYGLSESYLRDYLIENKFILNKANKNEFSTQLKRYNTKSLKKILKKHGLKTSGKRDRIEKRILEHNLIGNDYYLSSKSKVFYKNKKRRIKIFDEFLHRYYYFTEFNEYYMDNYRKKVEKIPIDFINRHIEKATEDKNHKMFVFNNQVMAELYYSRDNKKMMLEHVLKIFCINLNPVWKLDDLKNHGGFSIETYENLLYLKEQIGKNRIISAYFVIWDTFNFENVIVSKYVGYKYLKDILNLKNYNNLIKDLETNFYLNEDLKIKKITQKTLFDF